MSEGTQIQETVVGFKYRINIKGMPPEKEYNKMKLEQREALQPKLDNFLKSAKKGKLNAAFVSVKAAFNTFKEQNKITEWFYVDKTDGVWHDKSVDIWYT